MRGLFFHFSRAMFSQGSRQTFPELILGSSSSSFASCPFRSSSSPLPLFVSLFLFLFLPFLFFFLSLSLSTLTLWIKSFKVEMVTQSTCWTHSLQVPQVLQVLQVSQVHRPKESFKWSSIVKNWNPYLNAIQDRIFSGKAFFGGQLYWGYSWYSL